MTHQSLKLQYFQGRVQSIARSHCRRCRFASLLPIKFADETTTADCIQNLLILQHHHSEKDQSRASCLERLSKNQVVACRVAGIFTIYLFHFSPVKEPVPNCSRDGLFTRNNVSTASLILQKWTQKFEKKILRSSRP